jgi:DNA replication protein DnaC
MIPSRYKTAHLEEFSVSVTVPVLSWIADPKEILFVTGPSGCGKTHLLCAIVNHIITDNQRAAYVVSPDISLQLRESFGEGFDLVESEKDIITRYRKNIVGAFDDIAANKCTEYVAESWYAIINYRYQNCVPSIYASNHGLGVIADLMGDRISSRLASGVVISMNGEDRRFRK